MEVTTVEEATQKALDTLVSMLDAVKAPGLQLEAAREILKLYPGVEKK